MAKIQSLIRLFGKKTSHNAEKKPATQAEERESPYARYLQDRFASPNERVLTPASRDVFLLDPQLHHAADTVGLFHRQKNILLVRDPSKGETQRIMRLKPEPDSTVFFGNWRGFGGDGPAGYDPVRSSFTVWYQPDQDQPDTRFIYGLPGQNWIPLVGDWDGDGKDGVGVYDPSTGYFFLRNSLSAGLPDYYFKLARVPVSAIPLVGDWNGDGISGVGVYVPESGVFYLADHLDAVMPEREIRIERPQEQVIPLVGDWNGAGHDKLGLYLPRQSRFLLWSENDLPRGDISFRFSHKGLKGVPVSLRWSN